MVLDEGGFDDDVAEIFFDAIIAFEHTLDDRLIVRDTARHEFQQIVIAAANQMAFDDLVELRDTAFETRKVAATVLAERNLGEYRQDLAQLVPVAVCALAGDVARLF